MMKKILWKILYIDREMDEKAAAKVLEDALNRKTYGVFAFTVVDNPFKGLECTEHTDYDAIFISSNENADLNAWDFLRLLRNIGCEIPIILLHDLGQQLPSSFILPSKDSGISQLSFSSVLRKPYTIDDLVKTISDVFNCDILASIETVSADIFSSSNEASQSTGTRIAKAPSSSLSASVPPSLVNLTSYQSSSDTWTPAMKNLLDECESPNSI